MDAHFPKQYTTISQNKSCILWMAFRNKAGYGQVRYKGQLWLAHRLSYHLAVAPVAPGEVIMHSCDTPACVNPAHLLKGTHALNVKDKEDKGRGNGGEANGQAKLTAEQVLEIRKAYATNTRSQASLAREYGVNRSCINKIVRNTHWRKNV